MGIEIADGLRVRALEKKSAMGVWETIVELKWLSPEVDQTEG
jgi:hypothetical protein